VAGVALGLLRFQRDADRPVDGQLLDAMEQRFALGRISLARLLGCVVTALPYA
jgi:hypothetical protein